MLALESSWELVLRPELQQPYLKMLKKFLKKERLNHKIIYPDNKNIFKAFWLTPFDLVKVVIIGQDPYHAPHQAQGLAFSVPLGIKIPPSLHNIYKELQVDLGIPFAAEGDLTAWAQQGVLLLNSVLTVEAHKPASHQGKGWEIFTDRVIQTLNAQKKGLVFVLWGAYAQKKSLMIDTTRHLVLSSSHPSPFSASKGFLGSRPFSTINAYLAKNHQTQIVWKLPECVSV